MRTYCENPFCQNRSVKQVPVCANGAPGQTRPLCATCEEVYTWGVQYGMMTNKMYDVIEQVLQSLDVGGEQSRQFAEEIKMLRDAIKAAPT